MSAGSNVVSVLKGPTGWAVVGLVGVAVLYFFSDKLIGKKTAGAPGNGYVGGVLGAVGGTSDAQASTNLDGSQQSAYEGKGVIGSLGATTNNLTGGALSSAGDAIGGWIYDLTHLDSDSSSP